MRQALLLSHFVGGKDTELPRGPAISMSDPRVLALKWGAGRRAQQAWWTKDGAAEELEIQSGVKGMCAARGLRV